MTNVSRCALSRASVLSAALSKRLSTVARSERASLRPFRPMVCAAMSWLPKWLVTAPAATIR